MGRYNGRNRLESAQTLATFGYSKVSHDVHGSARFRARLAVPLHPAEHKGRKITRLFAAAVHLLTATGAAFALLAFIAAAHAKPYEHPLPIASRIVAAAARSGIRGDD